MLETKNSENYLSYFTIFRFLMRSVGIVTELQTRTSRTKIGQS